MFILYVIGFANIKVRFPYSPGSTSYIYNLITLILSLGTCCFGRSRCGKLSKESSCDGGSVHVKNLTLNLIDSLRAVDRCHCIRQDGRRWDENSHGPHVHLGPVLLPGQQLRSGVRRTSTLGAEGVGVSQDPGAVAQAEVCRTEGEGGGGGVDLRFWVY